MNARKLFRMSCNEYKHGKSCFKYGNYALIGKGAKVSNPLEALKAFEIGCSSNDEDTCFSAGLLYCGERPLRNMPMEIETNMAKVGTCFTIFQIISIIVPVHFLGIRVHNQSL